MGESTRMNQFNKIPKFTGDKNSDIIANFISSIQTNDFFLQIFWHIRLWTWSKIIVKVTTSTLFIRLVTKNNRKEGKKEEKERQTYRFFSGWSDSFYIWLFKRPTIAETSLRIDAVWSALLLFAHKYFWVYLFSMLKSAFRKGCNVLCTSGHNAWIMNYTRKQQHML